MEIVYEFKLLANLVLQDTIERIHVGKEYGDIKRGIFLIRGENIVLLGEVVSQFCGCDILINFSEMAFYFNLLSRQ